MTTPPSVPIPALTGWALILGASSGFGEAVGSVLARAGCHIIGVHMDRRATLPNVERIQNEIKTFGREAWFFNINAADEDKRREVCDEIARRFKERGKNEQVRVMLALARVRFAQAVRGRHARRRSQPEANRDDERRDGA